MSNSTRPTSSGDNAGQFRVMTSGVFTAAHLSLVPQLEALTGQQVVTVTTSIGTGDKSIPERLKRFEAVDLIIVSESNMQRFIDNAYIAPHSTASIARSAVAVAVREGSPAPDVSCAAALKQTLLRARSIAYSASESGKYLTTCLYQKLGIAEACLPKSRFVGGGERTGAVVARGDAELAFQQVSELLPVPGIAHITPIPAELQSSIQVIAGVAAWSRNSELAAAVVRLLASGEAVSAIRGSGLVPTRGVAQSIPGIAMRFDELVTLRRAPRDTMPAAKPANA